MAEGRIADGAPAAERLGWRLGVQAYTFNRFTFFEAIDKVAALGLHTIEAYPGQQVRADKPDVKSNHEMDPAARDEVREKLADADVKLACYGVVRLANDEGECRKVFDFAKAMGVETVVAEPEPDAFDLLDALVEEVGISLAIHNHPAPSRYAHPDTVLEVCEGRSPRIGSCADTGHWMRSGVEPLDALKLLEGRIISVHFKDLNEKSREAHDVPWGTGVCDARALLEELHRQGLKGVFSAEYEYNWESSLPELAECVRFFDRVAAELAGSAA